MQSASKPKKPRKTSVLTEKQSVYVEARLDGKSKKEANALAGYAPTDCLSGKSDEVAKALAEGRNQLSDAAQIKRADVLLMLTEAYDMAKLAAEPASMVSAAREIGKMLGFYEPETIKVELSMSQAKLQRKFEVMTDEQLLEIAEGRAKIIEGDYTRLS